MADFLIIGAGIAGASVAYELAAHGSVVVLEREDVAGHHSTGRSAATFNASYGHPVLRQLARASREFHEAPPAGFAEYPLLSPRGALLIANREHPKLLEGDPALARLSPDEVCRHVPALRSEWLAGGLYDADSRDIDVNALHQGYLRGAKARGAQPDELDIALGADRLAQCSKLTVDRIYRKWAGLRTFAPNRGVVIGFAPASPGFFWFVGQGGSGSKIAPAAARLAASLIVKDTAPPDLSGLEVSP